MVTIDVSDQLRWSVSHNGKDIIKPSVMEMKFSDGTSFGRLPKVKSISTKSVANTIAPLFYRKSEIQDCYNQLLMKFAKDYSIEVRAYDSGVAYRFVGSRKYSLTILSELVNYNFGNDCKAIVPYAIEPRQGDPYCVSFESYYEETSLSKIFKDSLIITPMLVDMGDGCKVALMDAGQEDYPGMFMKANEQNDGITGAFATYPLAFKRVNANLLPTKRAAYIAKTKGTRTFPWRVAVISDRDVELADNDLAYCLAPENRLTDTSWIMPGKAAWDWWNAINVIGVDFQVGINEETYKHYIDFAAENKLEYFVIDAGWCSGPSLLDSRVDMKELAAYGKSRNVGLFIWAGCSDLLNGSVSYEEVFRHYARMGIKGFKIDFLDRDDQVMAKQLYDMAKSAASHHLMLDYHGMKALGVNRPYPNVLSYEGVKGLENLKWVSNKNEGMPKYDVTIPFIRALTGAMDYTPGAMDNANPRQFRAINENPMGMGTRVHQMAMYPIFEAPLQMLSDAPHKYRKNQECTDFIAKIPTVFEETVILDGQVGEFILVAKKAKGVWYVAAMTNGTKREIDIDFSFLRSGTYNADIFADGVNANRNGKDYKRSQKIIEAGQKIKASLAANGGWTAILTAK